MTAPSKGIKGFGVTCPMCGDPGSTVRLDLNRLTECVCSACEEEFSPASARDRVADQLARWEAILRWIDSTAGLDLG